MEGWKETELGLIPNDWEQGILSDFAEKPQYGYTDSASNTGNTKFLRITDITDIGVNWDNVPCCNCPDIEKYKLINGDIVFARIGATTGKSYIINNPPLAVFASYLIRVRTKIDLLSDYLIYYFNSECYWKQINAQKGNNLKGGVNGSILNNLKIIIPPLSEQRKIAYILSTVQQAIEQQDKLIRTTTELKKALMQKLFTEGINGEKQKQTKIGLAPESWEVVEINDMYDFTNKPRNLFVDCPVAFIPMEFVPLKDIYIKTYEFRDTVSSGTYVENGDLLLAKITPSFENGKQGFVDIDRPYAYATTEVIPIRNKESANNLFYLFYYLLKDDIRKQLTDKMEGSTGRQRLSKNILAETLIPKPSIDEQKQIVEIFYSLDKKILFCQKKKHSLTALFKTLLHELMTGQRRVNEIDFERTVKLYKITEPPLAMVAEEKVEYAKTKRT